MIVSARFFALLTIAVMLAIPSTVLAQTNTFYVSPAGSDQNEGSINAPWQTLRYAVARLRPGTTLYLRSGTYTGPANTIDSQSGTVPSGTSWSNAVTIAGYPGETATIQPPNLSAIRLTFTAPHYLVFQDFTIDLSNQVAGSPDDAVYLSQGAHHNRFLRMTVQHTLNMCFQIARTPEGVESPFNEIIDSTINTCWGYGIYNSTDDTLIKGNDFHDIGHYGVVSYGSRNVIRNNRIHDTGQNRAKTSYGIVIGSFAHPTKSLDCLVYNNLIYNNQGGIFLYSNSGNIGVYNNTIYDNLPFAGIAMQYYFSGSTIRNNIVYANGADIVDYGGGTGVHTLDHNLFSDPGFIDAAAGEFQLRSASGARDAGATISTVSTDFSGTPRVGSYDIGAYEYTEEANALSRPANLHVVSIQ